MATVLSIFSNQAYKEYVLPPIRNDEVELELERSIFGLREDILLRMEKVDSKWHFIASSDYKVWIRASGGNSADECEEVIEGLYILKTRWGESLSIIVKEKKSCFVAYEKYFLDENLPLTIGNTEGNSIRYSFRLEGQQFVSRDMATIRRMRSGAVLEDHGRNGIFVNCKKVQGALNLYFGDTIDIWGLNLVYLGNIIAIRCDAEFQITGLRPWNKTFSAVPVGDNTSAKQVYHRAPRNMEPISSEGIEIEAPPQPKDVQEQPMFMLIGPAMTMAIPMAMSSIIAVVGSRLTGQAGNILRFTGIITAVCSAMLGAFWALMNIRYGRDRARKEENRRFEMYSNYLIRVSDEIRQKYEGNIAAMHHMYPEATEVVKEETFAQNLLWSRNSTHPDFLSFRLGLGDIPFQVPVTIPKDKFTLINDSLAEKPRMIRESYKMLHNVPICADLATNNIIGIIGGKDKAGAFEIVKILAAQIASQNCYTDVKMAFTYRGEDDSKWNFAKWFPHVWSQDKKVRYVASNQTEAGDIFYKLVKILRQRNERRRITGSEKDIPKPWYVLFVEDPSFLEGELIRSYIGRESEGLGITVILMAESYEELPNDCECIIQNDEEFKGIYNVRGGERSNVAFDTVSLSSLEKFGRQLSNLEVTETEVGGDIPNSINFFDMYGVSRLSEFNVAERWKKNRTFKTMRALVGQMAGGAPCYLDVHEKYHGPHGLVAGTTGSGKSETLQTYMLSLAINFSPDDIGFFIIDYKGGGMANLFNGLPHLLGSISNLSGNQVKRAMVSIKSENRRRQRIFNENGVNNINAYTQLFKNGEADVPIPHLFIIIDEFAELKREQGDFMKELISVAQVGRSLGVHLILATQKPNGTVDDNIWSNSKFRLCLRVQDKQDSTDMLHRPDAAFLTQAGRCYLQVGNDELFELFQSGWSGATYDAEAGNVKQVLAMMLAPTGKAALVGSHVKKKYAEQRKIRWIGMLTEFMESAEAQAADSEDTSLVVHDMFRRMEEQDIEFPENDYNSRILTGFINLEKRLRTEEETWGFMNREQRDRLLLQTADKEHVKLPEVKDITQLDAIVEYLAEVAKDEGYEEPAKLWLPVLPEHLALDSLEGFSNGIFRNGRWPEYSSKWELSTPVGLCDDPANQIQMPLEVNFTKNGNLAVLGSSMCGKSTLLQTIVYGLVSRYSPDYFNVYLLDFSSRMMSVYEAVPHSGGVLYESDLETVGKFFKMIDKIIAQRKALFRGGNYQQFVMTQGVACPAILIVIDGMATFREKTGQKFDDTLLRLTRSCTSYGIYFAVSAGGFNTTEIPSRMRDNFNEIITLSMADKYQYADALGTMQISVIPEDGIHGRGLAMVEGGVLEYQAAVAQTAPDDYSRNEKISDVMECFRKAWSGKRAVPIPKIPEKPVWEIFAQDPEVRGQITDDRHIPIGYDIETADIYSIDLSTIYTYLIQGKARTGKSYFLTLVANLAAERGGKIVIIDNSGQEMRRYASENNLKYITDYTAFRVFMLEEFIPLFQKRNKMKNQWIAEGLEEQDIYNKFRSEQEYYVLITNLTAFIGMIYSQESRNDNMDGGLTNLIEKGFLHNIWLFAAMDQDTRNEVAGKAVFERFIRPKTGIHFGGNVISQRTFEFQGMPVKLQSVIDKPGIATIPTSGSESYRKIVVPLPKGKN